MLGRSRFLLVEERVTAQNCLEFDNMEKKDDILFLEANKLLENYG